jgi:hypothetical protein
MDKKLSYGQKAVRIMDLLNRTAKTDHQIAAAIGCHVTYVRALRRRMAHLENLIESEEAETETETETESANDIQMGGDHYKRLGVEPWDVFDTWPIEQRIGAYRANCTKYVMRLDAKDTPLLNAQKLAHYAQKLVEVLEER